MTFLIDSGSSGSIKLFGQLLTSQAPIHHLRRTTRTLKGVNWSPLKIMACPHVTFSSWICVWNCRSWCATYTCILFSTLGCSDCCCLIHWMSDRTDYLQTSLECYSNRPGYSLWTIQMFFWGGFTVFGMDYRWPNLADVWSIGGFDSGSLQDSFFSLNSGGHYVKFKCKQVLDRNITIYELEEELCTTSSSYMGHIVQFFFKIFVGLGAVQ